MAIELRPKGEAAAAAAAGSMIGAARKAAQDWEMQKMILNSQQDFAHEQRMRQAELDRFARAKEWELEKMEIRSRIDFQQEESDRQRKKAEKQAKISALDKAKESGRITDEEYSNYSLQLETGIPVTAYKMQERESPWAGLIESLKEEKAGEAPTPTTLRPEELKVISPEGRGAVIKMTEWQEAQKEGAKLAPGQVLPLSAKSPQFQLAQQTWVKAEFDRLSKGHKSLNPVTYWKSKRELTELVKKYPQVWAQYLRGKELGK